MVRIITLAGASAAVLATATNAFTVTITNACSGDIELYTRLASVYTDESETIASGASVDKTIEKGFEGHFRNGSSDAATLIEFATKGDLDLAWYDIGIIPPRLDAGYEYCTSLQECMEHSDSGIGFNTAVEVTPQSNTGKDTCETLTCLQNGCEDAYQYPKDDTKTHSCAFGTDFVVTFCPSGDSTTQQQEQQQQQTSSSGSTTQETTQEETPAPETTAPTTTAPVTEAPATTAPVTEAPATDAPVQEASAASESGAGQVHTQDDSVNGESETTAPEVTQTETPAPTTVAPEATPAITPTATKSKYCVIRKRPPQKIIMTAITSAGKRLGRLLPQSSVLFVCDIQEVFRGLTFQLPTVIHGTNTMVSAAKVLDLPVVVTTQYGSRLGGTVSEISSNLEDAKDVKIFDKMKFSMLVPEVERHLTTSMPQRKSVLLCGIETHVCVLQTCLDLLDKGYDVHVVSDAVSSSTSYTRSMALERMRQSGAYITSVESAIFQLANDASNPEFKSISKLIKEHLKTENGFDTGARI